MAKVTRKSLSAGELSPDMYSRYDVDKYGSGCMIMKNWIIMAQGGAFKRPGTKYTADCGNEAKKVRLIPFQFSLVQAYVLEFGDQYMRVYKDGELVLESDKNIVSTSQANPCNIEVTGHGYTTGDEVFISGVGGMYELNNRQYTITVVDADNFTLDGIDSTAYTAFTTGGTVAKVYEVSTSYTEDELFDLYYAQTADVMTICHKDHAPSELTRTGHTAWTFSSITFAPSVAAPASPSATNSTGSGSTTYKYKVTAVVEENFEESLPSSEATCTNDLSTAGNENTFSWSAVSGAIKYNIYKDKSGTFGYIGSSESTSFIDDNIDPDVSDTPPRSVNPFPSTDNYPGVVAFAQQRRIFASSNNKPDTIWMSRTGLYSNFSNSIPAKDDDAITFAIASGQVNPINHLISFRQTLAMTDREEWKIYGDGGPIAPTTIAADPETNYGSQSNDANITGTAAVKPIKIGNTAVFSARYGKRIRDYQYTFEADGYDGNDLSVLSRHILEDRYIVDWDFAQEPDDMIWAVLSDGTLASLTYLREHRVWGWARHETEGFVESVAVIPDKSRRRDVVHFVVRRTINGQTRRYVEVMQAYIDDPMDDAWFLDCASQYSGSATNTVTGLWHLEGETVGVWADGNVLADVTVSGGAITLPSDYETILIGMKTDYELQPLADESDQGKYGSTKGDPKAIKSIDIEVINTRGLFAAQDKDLELNEIPPKFENDDLAGDIEGFTGILEVIVDPQWDDSYVAPYIYSNYPTPGKILSVTPDYALN